jgi:hypothetical protein
MNWRVNWFVFLVLPWLIIILVCLSSCAPIKPKTNTPVPSLTKATEINRSVRSNIVDSKDAIGRARRLNTVIDNKLNLLRDYK